MAAQNKSREEKDDRTRTVAERLAEIEKQGRQPWIMRTFFQADKNKDRSLDEQECGEVMKKLGLYNYRDAIFAMMDRNHDGKISLYEFLSTMDQVLDLKVAKVQWISGVFNIFHLYDAVNSKDGKITKEEFNKALSNRHKTKEERDKMWNEMTKYDDNHDGVLTFDEFVRYYESIQIDLKQNKRRDSTDENDTKNKDEDSKEEKEKEKNNDNNNNNVNKKKPKMRRAEKIDAFGKRAWIMSQFFKADKNKDRLLNKKECETVVGSLGLSKYNDAIFAMLDENVDGKISILEFVKGMEIVMQMKAKNFEWLDYVFSIFEKYDVNVKDGKITREEFKAAYGKGYSGGGDENKDKDKAIDAQADNVWKQITAFDENNDGVISFNEFVKFYASIKIDFGDKAAGMKSVQ